MTPMRARWIVLLFVLLTACSTSPTGPLRSPSSSPKVSGSSSPLLLRFAVIGDWGAGTSDERAIAQRLCTIRSREPFRYLVTTGDNFYKPDGRATEANFTAPTACLRSGGIEWRATWGNHDVGADSTASVLGATRRYYTWSAGGVDFFMLDSNAVNPTQTTWLEKSLAASRARVKIAVFHHPPFTAGLHAPNQAVQDAWVPLFDRYHVTLVLSGHNHEYEHSKVKGIDYVVSGGGGAERYACLGFPSYLITCKSIHHVLVVEVRERSLDVSAIDEEGRAFDKFTITMV